ncbi:MAG: cytochrome d ubiquinol oxidase subunit II [Phycisphaerales bacterium]
MPVEYITAWVIVAAMLVYVLLGGADFGAGVWDALARGPRRKQQRGLIEQAIGPIWEANHIWLIVVIVVMFVCFPRAFAMLSTALHIPLTLMLLGIVARGSAFVFRAYDAHADRARRVWGRVFSVASVLTPVLLGVSLGTALSGALTWNDDGVYTGGFFAPWLRVFPWLVGLMTLALFAFLAAVFLTVEAEDESLRQDFRRRAIASGVAVGVFAWAARGYAHLGAPEFAARLSGAWWSWPLVLGASLIALAALWALWTRRDALARTLAVIQTALVVVGFAAALFPDMVLGEITIEEAAAVRTMHWLVLGALGVGSLILIPSLIYLLRVFKGPKAFALLR